jgi:HK97 family phage portal protein
MSYLDNRTIGRYPARTAIQPQTYAPSSPGYSLMFTRGDELLTPAQYRGSFDQALQRAVGYRQSIGDEQAGRAFGVSHTGFVCTEYRATTTAGIALKIVDPTKNLLENTLLSQFTTIAPNVLANAVRSYLIWGRFYFRKRRNAAGWPTGLEWINPIDVFENIDHSTGEVINYVITYDYGRETVLPSEVIYNEAFDPTPQGNGLSRFEVAFRALNVELGITTYAAAFFLNGAQPDGVLTFEQVQTSEQMSDNRKAWKENFQGVQKAHKTAVLSGNAKYQPITANPKDLAMVELKDSEREDICAIFEVDPILVGLKGVSDPLSANSTYSTSEVAHLRRVTLPFLNMILLPALNRQWAHKDFDRRDYYTLAVDESAIPALAEANLMRSETAVSLSTDTGGLLDFNEARKLVGYDERPGYLVRNPKDALTLWEKGTITLNLFHQLIGTPNYIESPNGDVVLIGGQLLPFGRLMEAAAANVKKLTTPPPPPMLPGVNPNNPPGNLPPGGKPTDPPIQVSKPEPPQLPAFTPEQPAQRSERPLSVVVSFAENQFIRYARRALSEALTEQKISAEWTAEKEWNYPLAFVDDWTPKGVSGVLRTVDYADTKKADVRTSGYVLDGDKVYLSLSDSLDTLRKAVALDLTGASLNVRNAPMQPGILLCTVNGTPDVGGVQSPEYPLVANNVTLVLGNEAHHRWQLRAYSDAQLSELKQWRHKAERKGADVKFEPLALDGHNLTTFVSDALLAGVGVDDTFAVAESMLKGEYELRAYGDTREAFVDLLTDLFSAGQQDEISRRALAARMRSQLRKVGLQTFRDGLLAGGLDVESYSTDQLAVFNDWLSEQSGFVTKFGAEMYGEGLSESEVKIRAEMWANKSMDTLYYRAVALAAPHKLYRWELGVTEHCETCLANKGLTRSMSEWVQAGLPRGNHLECGGYNCQCSLVSIEAK